MTESRSRAANASHKHTLCLTLTSLPTYSPFRGRRFTIPVRPNKPARTMPLLLVGSVTSGNESSGIESVGIETLGVETDPTGSSSASTSSVACARSCAACKG